MRFNRSFVLSGLLTLGTAAVAVGCGDDGGGGGGGTMPVTLSFAGEVDGEAFACGEEYVVGANDTALAGADFRLFLSDVRLLTADGGEVPMALTQDGTWQLDGLALLDFEDGTTGCDAGNPPTRTVIEGTVPDGDYTGVRFDVGVPFDQNHVNDDVAPSPLSFTAMNWHWLGGYKFIRFDGSYPDRDGGWFLHLGSTVCTNADGETFPSMEWDPASTPAQPCDNPNLMEDVTLDGFDPLTETIVVDMGRALAESAVDENDGLAIGCQSAPPDTDCAQVFPRMGLAHSGNAAGAQQLFSTR